MRAESDCAVLAWIADRPREALCTASTVQTKSLCGVALLLGVCRKTELAKTPTAMFAENFAVHVPPYDDQAERRHAEVVTQCRASGKVIDALNALIAATTHVIGDATAPSNAGGFAGCSIDLIGPRNET